MRCLLSVSTLLAAFVLVSSSAPAQQPKAGDPKKGNPTPDKWPKEIKGKGLDAWAKDIKDNPDPSMRELAIKTVPFFGPDCRKVAGVNLLAALLKDPDHSVRLVAAEYTPLIGFEEVAQVQQAVAALVQMTRDHQMDMRQAAILALAHCGQFGKPAMATLAGFCVSDPSSWQVRKAACTALGALANIDFKSPDGATSVALGPDMAAVNALLKAARDRAVEVRREAIHALTVLTPPNGIVDKDYKEWSRALAPLKADHDKVTGIMVRVCLCRLERKNISEDNPNLKELVGFFSDKDPAVRYAAITGIGQIGSEAAPKLPELQGVVDRDEDESCQVAAIWTMANFGNEASIVIPYLTKLQGHKKEAIRQAAGGALYMLNTGKQRDEIEKKEKKDTKEPRKDALPPRKN